MKRILAFYLNATDEEFKYELEATIITIMFVILLMVESGVKL